ncbi:MAG: glycoside hydrolase [Euryarchaeota archaeon]|nr:glycoside hydrolase [Euryarchaeota archaeon]
MRPALLLALVLLALPSLAGCLDDAVPSRDDGADELPQPFPTLPDDVTPFSRMLCDGDTLASFKEVREDGCNVHVTAESGPAAEVSLAVDPTDPLALVGGSKDFSLGMDERCGKYNVWSGVHVSHDGGRTWTHDLLPGHPGDDRETALSVYACGSDPVVVVDPNGVFYYVSIHFTADPEGDDPPVAELGPVWGSSLLNAGLAVTRSLDQGRTWEDPVVLVHREDGSLIDKEWAAVDATTGSVYVSYLDTGDGAFYVQRNDDGGVTWDGPFLVDAGEDGTQQFGQVAVDPEGVVHFTYWSTDDGNDVSAVYHRSSADHGRTWSERGLVVPFVPVFDFGFTHKYRIVSAPALAVDPVVGTLYVAYPSPAAMRGTATPAGYLDLYITASSDGGRTWNDPVRVNDERAAPLNGQALQTLAVGPDGIVHTTWLDYRHDPSGQWSYLYYAYSTDDGVTWSENARVSDVPFDGTGGYHQSGSGTIGDYNGLAVSSEAVHAFWADTRYGRNDVFSATILG